MVMRSLDTRAKSITNRKESTSFEKYLKDISNPTYKLLSTDEEVELGWKIKEWDIDARNNLVEGNLRFVVSVAKQYLHYCKWLEIWDLIWEWNLWLVKAAERFDETRWFKFISYAVWRIRQSILQYISSQHSLIRRPLNQELIRQKITTFSNIFFMENLRDPTKEEIQKEFPRLDDKKYSNYLDAVSSISIKSLDEQISPDDDDNFGSTIINYDSISPDADLEMDDERALILKTLKAKLKPNEFQIITSYFGIWKDRAKSFQEIAEEMDLSRERVRQIKDRVCEKLAKTLHWSELEKLYQALNE